MGVRCEDRAHILSVDQIRAGYPLSVGFVSLPTVPVSHLEVGLARQRSEFQPPPSTIAAHSMQSRGHESWHCFNSGTSSGASRRICVPSLIHSLQSCHTTTTAANSSFPTLAAAEVHAVTFSLRAQRTCPACLRGGEHIQRSSTRVKLILGSPRTGSLTNLVSSPASGDQDS
jgi:hypothetical protein